MSLILTSQDNEVNSKPNNYQNYFSSTYKIEKDSLIALNHVTVNRNAYFNFDEDKVLAFYHGIEQPSKTTTFMKNYFRDDTGHPFALLQNVNVSITNNNIFNFVNYPMFVRIERGEYNIDQLCDALQTKLNNPSGEYGGDFHVTGEWAVTPQYTSNSEFSHVEFAWSTKPRNTDINGGTKTLPSTTEFVKNYTNNDNITIALKTGNITITGGNANANTCECNRFISHQEGSIKYFMPSSAINGTIVGLSRVTSGKRFQTFENTQFTAGDLAVETDIDEDELLFFDICVVAIDDVYHLYYLSCEEIDEDKYLYTMEKYEYNSPYVPVNQYTADSIEFVVDGNSYKVIIAGQTTETIELILPPTNNNTYQLIPKVTLKGTQIVTIKGDTQDNIPDLLPDYIVPIVPNNNTTNVKLYHDYSNCNIGWILENQWKNKGEKTSPTANGNWLKYYFGDKANSDYLATNYSKFHTWTASDADVDSSEVHVLGNSLTIDEMKSQKYWWSYKFDPTLNSGDGGFEYQYIPYDNTVFYLYELRGTAIIPYAVNNVNFHCGATLDGAIGIQPRYKKGDAGSDFDGDQIVVIEGTNRLALTNNDLLYIRIDLGNTYTMNGNTSMVSKIISPIITDTSVGSTTQLGIRTYTPERMYLKLNNTEDLYINSINVSIVTKNETFARDLAPTTSASFHIIKNKQ